MALNSIETEWVGFAGMVLGSIQPSATQVAEMKKSFFAGAWAMFTAMEEIGCPHISEAEAEAYLNARKAECLEFTKRLMADHAERN